MCDKQLESPHAEREVVSCDVQETKIKINNGSYTEENLALKKNLLI